MRLLKILAGVLLVACSDKDRGHAGSTRDAGPETGGSAGSPAEAGDASADRDTGADAHGDGDDAGFLPERLSETGLYSDLAAGTLAAGVLQFRPEHELWSDGAAKSRFVYLPPAERIDSTDMNAWRYPVGTKLWKEFVRDQVRVETRLLYKYREREWFMMAYQWSADGSDALAAPDGVTNASGTAHDIPNQSACRTCHDNLPDRVLGFSAIQLSHELGGVTLNELIATDRLTTPPQQPLVIPGDAVARKALGYLHANCGLCHNPNSVVFGAVDLELWLKSGELGQVSDTASYRSSVGVATSTGIPTSAPYRISPGKPDESSLVARMNTRGSAVQMPPIASELVDPNGLAALRDFVTGL